MIKKAQNGLEFLRDRMQEEHDAIYNDYAMRAPGANRQANIAQQYFNRAPTIQNLSKGVYHWVQSDPLRLYGAWQGIKQDIRRFNRENDRKQAKFDSELSKGQYLEALQTLFRKSGGTLTINNVKKYQNAGKFTINKPQREFQGRYRRVNYPAAGGWQWIDAQSGIPITQEIIVGNYILKPDGSKVSLAARRMNTQRARASVKPVQSQPVQSQSVQSRTTTAPKTVINTFQRSNRRTTVTPKTTVTPRTRVQTRSSQTTPTLQTVKESTLNNFNQMFDSEIANLGAPEIPVNVTPGIEEQLIETPSTTINETPSITVNETPINFNRTQIRQKLREMGYNPYQFGGLQRRSYRRYLNNQATEKDLQRIQSMGII